MPLALLIVVPLAVAMPLRGPLVPTDSGHFEISAGLAGYGDAREVGRVPERGLRFDVLPLRGIGFFGDAAWRTLRRASGQSRDLGWSAGGGMRVSMPVLPSIAVGVAGRGSIGTFWRLMPGDVRENEERLIQFEGMPALVVKTAESDLCAWVGPAFTLTGTRLLEPGGGTVDWTDGSGNIGVEIGGEAHSGDLLGYGVQGQLFVIAGISVHAVDRFGAAAWLGVGF